MDSYRPTFSIVNDMLDAAADMFGIEPWDITKRGRSRQQFIPRFAVIWVLRQLSPEQGRGTNNPFSYPRLAKMLGYEDHTSVLHGYREAEKYRDKWPKFRRITDELLRFARSTEPRVLSKAA